MDANSRKDGPVNKIGNLIIFVGIMNFCMNKKRNKKKQKEKKYAKNCIKLTSPKRVGWFITSQYLQKIEF